MPDRDVLRMFNAILVFLGGTSGLLIALVAFLYFVQ